MSNKSTCSSSMEAIQKYITSTSKSTVVNSYTGVSDDHIEEMLRLREFKGRGFTPEQNAKYVETYKSMSKTLVPFISELLLRILNKSKETPFQERELVFFTSINSQGGTDDSIYTWHNLKLKYWLGVTPYIIYESQSSSVSSKTHTKDASDLYNIVESFIGDALNTVRGGEAIVHSLISNLHKILEEINTKNA